MHAEAGENALAVNWVASVRAEVFENEVAHGRRGFGRPGKGVDDVAPPGLEMQESK